MTVPVILASASPRRRELLTLIGIPHEVRPADVDESVRAGEEPVAYVDRLAREKALAVAQHDAQAVIIAADTTVVLDGEILGKPGSVDEAVAMVTALAGRTHLVFTGVAVCRGGRITSHVDQVAVTMRPLRDSEIRAYVATGEPMDKAGAYAIQGLAGQWVSRIEGSYSGVMGLPLFETAELLRWAGIQGTSPSA